jgi:hypothetical protein
MSDKQRETDMQREKTQQRSRYMKERDAIIAEIGSLTKIRDTIGLSQRRICQLLLVDPSAWTRWLKTEAPPHIYQALKWLILLQKGGTNLTAPRDVESRIEDVHDLAQKRIKELEGQVSFLTLQVRERTLDRREVDLLLQKISELEGKLEGKIVKPSASEALPPKRARKVQRLQRARLKRLRSKKRTKKKPVHRKLRKLRKKRRSATQKPKAGKTSKQIPRRPRKRR